jgi:hypothetical protein
MGLYVLAYDIMHVLASLFMFLCAFLLNYFQQFINLISLIGYSFIFSFFYMFILILYILLFYILIKEII